MANFLMPKGHVMHNRKDDASGVDGTLAATAKGDVVHERRALVSTSPIGEIAAGSSGVVVANGGDDSVSILDPATLAVRETIAVDGEAVAVAVSDDRAYVGVAGPSFDAVAVIDLGTKTVIKTYPVAYGITALAVSPDGKRVYAGRATQDRVDVAVIDVTAERVGTICLLYTSPSPRDGLLSRMPSSA